MIGTIVNKIVERLHKSCARLAGKSKRQSIKEGELYFRYITWYGPIFNHLSDWTYSLWMKTMLYDSTVASGEVN